MSWKPKRDEAEHALTKDEVIRNRKLDDEHHNTGCGYVERFGKELQLCAYNKCSRCSHNPNRRQEWSV